MPLGTEEQEVLDKAKALVDLVTRIEKNDPYNMQPMYRNCSITEAIDALKAAQKVLDAS